MPKKYWLMKSEPNEFSIDDLKGAPNATEHWDGVRNYQARNFLRDEMKMGDAVLFYHSGKDPAVVGTARVAREGYPDFTAWDPKNRHYDPKSTQENPRWFMVDVKFRQKFDTIIPLQTLKDCPELEGMQLLRKGNRLSVMPIEKSHWHFIVDAFVS